jgi:hypothetical protein
VFGATARSVIRIASMSNKFKDAKQAVIAVLGIILLAVVFTFVLAEMVTTFNITGFLATVITFVPTILGVVALLLLFDIL